MGIKDSSVNKKLNTNDMINFVVTENCSFLCADCLRKDRRPNTISEEVIDAFLSQVIINGVVHLSGGEPLLQIKRIIYLINRIYELGNMPKEISVITNGSVGPEKFEEFVSVLVARNAKFNLMVSNDYYHVQERLRLNKGEDNILTRIREYQKILVNHGFRSPIDDYFWMLEEYGKSWDDKEVLAIGRGENIAGATIKKRNFILQKNVHLRGENIKGELEVHTNGIITPRIDMSWEERDAHYGPEYSILNNPLRKILKGPKGDKKYSSYKQQ